MVAATRPERRPFQREERPIEVEVPPPKERIPFYRKTGYAREAAKAAGGAARAVSRFADETGGRIGTRLLGSQESRAERMSKYLETQERVRATLAGTGQRATPGKVKQYAARVLKQERMGEPVEISPGFERTLREQEAGQAKAAQSERLEAIQQRTRLLEAQQRLKASQGKTGLGGFISGVQKSLGEAAERRQRFEERQIKIQEARGKAQQQVEKAAQAAVLTRLGQRALDEQGAGGGMFGQGPGGGVFGRGPDWLYWKAGSMGAPSTVGTAAPAQGTGQGSIFGPAPAWLDGFGAPAPPPPPEMGPPPPTAAPEPAQQPAAPTAGKPVYVKGYFRAPPEGAAPKGKEDVIAQLARAALKQAGK